MLNQRVLSWTYWGCLSHESTAHLHVINTEASVGIYLPWLNAHLLLKAKTDRQALEWGVCDDDGRQAGQNTLEPAYHTMETPSRVIYNMYMLICAWRHVYLLHYSCYPQTGSLLICAQSIMFHLTHRPADYKVQINIWVYRQFFLTESAEALAHILWYSCERTTSKPDGITDLFLDIQSWFGAFTEWSVELH